MTKNKEITFFNLIIKCTDMKRCLKIIHNIIYCKQLLALYNYTSVKNTGILKSYATNFALFLVRKHM